METSLKRVIYERFSFERDIPIVAREHALDRQVRFEFSDGKVIFASWTEKPVLYCVGKGEQSFFTVDPEAVLDMSTEPPWRDLVGEPIEFIFLDEDHQTMEVRSARGSAFISSKEADLWGMDVITISPDRPE
jgi:hypothetical protein